MTVYQLPRADFEGLLHSQGQIPTFAPSLAKAQTWVDSAPDGASAEALGKPRAAQSPKGFFLPAAESMGRYGASSASTAVEVQPAVLMGVRACELRARNYLDSVMTGGDFVDPLYRARRETTTVVACDCTECAETCFCTLVGGRPWATEGFDVNLTQLDDGWLVEVATEKGRQWLADLAGDVGKFTEADPAALAKREKARQATLERLEKQNERFTFRASDETQPALPTDGDETWQRFAADCVECGACTHICPTCHCFYLYDQVLGAEQFERVRTWDSCLLSSYHRMAGGKNMKLSPRPELFSRLANRVLHKFTYSPRQYGLLGCVGCGRCIDACLGAIDIRQVVQELSP